MGSIEETITPASAAGNIPQIFLPANFNLQSADKNLMPASQVFHRQAAQIPLQRPLAQQQHQEEEIIEKVDDALLLLNGTFVGPGFNTIFRPHSAATPVKGLPAPDAKARKNLEVLELNLTHETWTFAPVDLSKIPNRGNRDQRDITLFGRSYTQSVKDVTNIDKGERIAVNRVGESLNKNGVRQPKDIHFEPGLFLSIPATDVNPKMVPTICRMASIPHGTTINAQGAGSKPVERLDFGAVDITPFTIGNESDKIPDKNGFLSQKVVNESEARLPQKLAAFKDTIPQTLLDNPNSLLNEHNKGKIIEKTIKFTVSTALPGKQFSPQRAAINALKKASESIQKNSGATITAKELDDAAAKLMEVTNTANIAFLDGATPGFGPTPTGGQIASAAKVTATFWISTVKHSLQVPQWAPQTSAGLKAEPLRLAPLTSPKLAGTVPTFVFPTDKPIKQQTVEIEAVQIQYSQNVLLNFNGLSWPHVSVATVVPLEDITVDAKLLK